jgi:arginyl-tRNA synthetase
MALQLEVESLDGLDEGVQQFYQQVDDGKYRLAVDGLEDTDGLKSALEKERKARREYEKKMKSLEDVDPDEYRQLKQQQQKAEEEKLQKEGEFEKLREKWSKEREQERQKYQEQVNELNRKLDTLYLDKEIERAALNAGVIPEDLEDVMAITKHRIKRADDGETIVVLDKDGEPSQSTLDKFFSQDFKEAKPKFYKSDVLPGSGSKPGGGPGPSRDTAMSRQDFIKEQFANAR